MIRDKGNVKKIQKKNINDADKRLTIVLVTFILITLILVGRLFVMMVIDFEYYRNIAEGVHSTYVELFPKRGSVFVQDSRTKEEYPIAINRDHFTVFSDTRFIRDDETAEKVAEKLSEIFGYDDEEKLALFFSLNKRTDAYEPIEHKVDESIIENIRELELPGVYFTRESYRVYPEKTLGAQVIGFLGKTESGDDVGRYGIEGYWEKELAGEEGFFEGEKSAAGRRIATVGGVKKEKEDGSDILLTIDRTLQYKTCEMLKWGMEHYEAEGATMIIMDPNTGAVRVMCSYPDFDPNIYNQVADISQYNNKGIFEPYEPGSIFKPITMAAALNEEAVEPDTEFEDTGEVEANCTKPIQNADLKEYGKTTMTGVLENSINTGMVFTVKELGKKKFISYLSRFGFGVETGIELNTEASGGYNTLLQRAGDDIDCYTATASFGQGITATPLQMVTAFGAIANGGTLLKPYIVEEVRYKNGNIEKTNVTEVERVLSKRTAGMLSGMLVNVIDSGQASGARVPGYYIAGKTGTAQIAGRGGYTDQYNHSFVGFGPVDNPAFVAIIKFEKPSAVRFSSQSAAPIFGKVAEFVLDYYGVVPSRVED